jgi:uncharacterized membrane protein YphA (DoxX/SURF4 family)
MEFFEKFHAYMMGINPSSPVIIGILLAGLALLWLAMRSRTRTDSPTDRLSTPARFFLVLLRFVIGWHFLIEGLEKLESPTWTSEGYLREAVGPLAPKFREMAGDSVIAQMTAAAEGKELPAGILEEWQRTFDAFNAHYKLDEKQQKKAQENFDAAKANAVKWYYQPRPVKKLSTYPPELVVEWSVPQRLDEYKRLQDKFAEEEAKLPERGEKAWKDWLAAKVNVSKWRSELKSDLDAQTESLKKSLYDVLSAEQKTGPPPTIPRRPFDWNRHLDVADASVKYGLIAIGACLILGLFTPLAALGGAAMLLMFYLAMPALPYLPESPKSEGHYLFVNKNIIEMIALLAIASLNTGRWAGLDGLLQFLNPFNWRRKKTVVVKTAPPAYKPVTKTY